MGMVNGRQRNKGEARALPAAWLAIMNKALGHNGLAYRRIECALCGRWLGDQAILIGEVRIKCSSCKFPNEQEWNRVGEDQYMHKVHNREEMSNAERPDRR